MPLKALFLVSSTLENCHINQQIFFISVDHVQMAPRIIFLNLDLH